MTKATQGSGQLPGVIDTRDLIAISLEDAFDYGVALHFIAAITQRYANRLKGAKAESRNLEAASWLEKARRLERVTYERASAAIMRGDVMDAQRLAMYQRIIDGAKATLVAR